MLAKVMRPRRDGLSSFRAAIRYACDETKCEFVLASDTIGSIETAPDEMRAVAHSSTTTRPDVNDPLYHFILTLPVGERLTPKQADEAIRAQVKALGFEGHQWTAGAHGDTDNQHIHVIVNRRSPETGRLHQPRLDFLTLDRMCRRIELAFGLSHDRGPYVVTYLDTRPQVLRRDQARALAEARRLSDGALAYERYTGRELFQSWLRGGAVKAAIDAATSWVDLHRTLRQHGLELREVEHGKGAQARRGLVIVSLDDERERAKASLLGEGCGLAALEARLGPYRPGDDWDLAAERVLEKLTSTDATFDRTDVEHQAAAYTDDPAELRTLVRLVLERDDILALAAPDTDGIRYTTRDILETETETLARVRRLAGEAGPTATAEAIRAAVEARTMREDQCAAFQGALDPDAGRVKLWQGLAGVGKSYALTAVKDAYEASGVRVIGMGPTNAVADDLAIAGLRETFTLHKAMGEYGRGRLRLDEKTVIVVDEAAMIDNDMMGRLLAAVEESGASVLLVGDDRQLPAIKRSGLFTEIAITSLAGEITQITRQQVAWQRQAAQDFAEGRFEAGMRAYHDNGAIAWGGSDEEAKERLIRQWETDTAADPTATRFVFAYINDDVDDLNARLRHVRESRGELGEAVTVPIADGSRTFAVHDRILITETAKRLGLINGQAGTLVAVDAAAQTITVAFDGREDDPVTIPLGVGKGRFDGVSLGYAGTIYKGQGKTLDHTYLLHSSHWRNAASYVALTRQKHSARVFASREVATDWRDLARQMTRRGTTRAASAYTVTDKPPLTWDTPAEGATTDAVDPDPAASAPGVDPTVDPNAALRSEWQASKAADHDQRHARWQASVIDWRTRRDQHIEALKTDHRAAVERIRARALDPGVRQLLLHCMKQEHEAHLVRVREDLRTELDRIGPAPERQTYRDFVAERAREGDARALAVQRDWRRGPTRSRTADRTGKGEDPPLDLPAESAPSDTTEARHRWETPGPYAGSLAEQLAIPEDHLRANPDGLRLDQDGNILFAQYGETGNLVGFEITTAAGTRMLPNSGIGLYATGVLENPACLVLVGSALEATALACLDAQDAPGSEPNRLYVSTGGELSEARRALLTDLARRHERARISLADADPGHRRAVEDIMREALGTGVHLCEEPPGDDAPSWSSALQAVAARETIHPETSENAEPGPIYVPAYGNDLAGMARRNQESNAWLAQELHRRREMEQPDTMDPDVPDGDAPDTENGPDDDDTPTFTL